MAQESGIAYRGLILLALMLGIVAVVGFILFRPKDGPPSEDAQQPQLVALGVAHVGATFPAQLNWGALAVLSQSLPSSEGWQVRYNAAQSLARRGSAKTPFDVLSQMLDEDQQMRNWRMPIADGKEVVDEYAARKTVIIALLAIEEWHKHEDAVQAVGRGNADLRRAYAAIDKLTLSSNAAVREQAESVKKAIGPWGEQRSKG